MPFQPLRFNHSWMSLHFQEMSDLLNDLHQLFTKRLWHQLTSVLRAIVVRPEMQDGDKLFQFYSNVIADFELK